MYMCIYTFFVYIFKKNWRFIYKKWITGETTYFYMKNYLLFDCIMFPDLPDIFIDEEFMTKNTDPLIQNSDSRRSVRKYALLPTILIFIVAHNLMQPRRNKIRMMHHAIERMHQRAIRSRTSSARTSNGIDLVFRGLYGKNTNA